MSQYFAVPASAIEDFLTDKKFERTVQRNEVVYSRKSSRNPNVILKVYTSIRIGASAVRGSGKDAIRACVIFDNGQRSFGIGKFPPVFRVTSTNSVLLRLDERLRQAAARGNEWIDNQAVRDAERAAEARGFLSDPDFQNLQCSEPPEAFLPGL